jgi:segregation and condensation protein B
METEPLRIVEPNGHHNGHGESAPIDEVGPPPAEQELGALPAVIESLLFAAGAPVPVARLVDALDGPSRAEVVAALDVLAARLEREGRGLRLVQVAGGHQLRTAPEHAPFVRRLLRERPPRLSRPMLETLAIVAYRQPCTRLEIEAIRGVDADAVLATLTERRLVRVVGRKDAPGRPLLYGTTREFLEVFGLPDLSALPTLRELGEGAAALAAVAPPGGDEPARERGGEPEAPSAGDEAHAAGT